MTAADPRIDAVRRFGRFYTGRIEALRDAYLGFGWSLAECRVLYELANREGVTAADLGRDLGLDGGYLSRILRRFAAEGLLAQERDPADGRIRLLRMTATGRDAFLPLDRKQNEVTGNILAGLPGAAANELVGAMRRIEELLGGAGGPAYVLRGLRPGDLGWLISRHGALYTEEYGWNGEFEVLVARIIAEAMERFDPAREGVWIAERDGVPVGSVMLVRVDDETAKLRVLLVEPAARGLGIGGRLIDECTAFSRRVGYRRIVLWTHSVLQGARRLYARAGYRLVASEPFEGFGQHLDSETWRLDL